MKIFRSLLSPEGLIGVAVVALFVLIGWLDYRNQERAVARFDTFSSFDYLHGGYRAWYELLQREGISVDRYQRRPAYLNDSVATLIVANNLFDAALRAQVGQPVGVYSEGDLAKLRTWVEDGGRLVWLVDQATAQALPTGASAPSLRRLLGSGIEAGLHLPHVEQSGPVKNAAVSIAPSPLTDGVRSVSGTSRLRMPFDANFATTPLIADDTGSVVGWYRLGKGSVVVVTDETLFENSRLGKADNARLAYNLAAQGLRPQETVAFEEWSHGYQSGDTWWSILPAPLRAALIIAGGALLLSLLGANWRFGPAARLPENIERTSEEYVISLGALLDRGRASRKALSDLACLALHSAARSVGLPDAAPASAIAARLRGSEAGDRRATEVLTLERFAGYEKPSPAEFLQAARLAIALRKEFALDGPQRIEPRRAAARRSA